MVKLIVSDFDGTLRSYSEENVREEVKNKIHQFLDNGIYFALSSGRTYNELVSYMPEFRDKIYFICCDGAYTVKNDKVVYSKQIDNADIDCFFKKVQSDSNISFVLHAAFENYSYGNLPSICGCYLSNSVVRSSDVGEKIYKITSYGEMSVDSTQKGLRNHWDGGECKCAQYVSRFANKGAALSDLQTKLMLQSYDTACIGDSGNDIAMMKNAKISCCIGRKSEELVSCCDLVAQDIIEAFDYVTK